MPTAVIKMLEALDPRPGHSVLEIGTGTGWNAALLAHRVGEEQVVTVEVDRAIAATARRNLGRAGVAPTVVEGDGALGWPDRAPYDRVIATCGVNQIPKAWLEQTVDGAAVSKIAVELPEVRENLARFVVGLLVPDCRAYGYHSDDEIWLLATDSWAQVEVPTGVVRQLGRRRLWDEVEAAYRWWERAGRPDLTRFGVNVTADRQWAWLGDSDQPVT